MEASQAAADVRMIRETIEKSRQRLAHGGGGHIMIIWGIAWAVGFGGTELLEPHQIGILWGVVNSIAAGASFLVGRRSADKVRTDAGDNLWKLWWALAGFGLLWCWMLQPMPGRTMGLFIASLAMLGYVVMGLWLDSRFLVGLGVAITLAGVAGYMLFPVGFGLWMAACGGGGLIAGGLYALRSWR